MKWEPPAVTAARKAHRGREIIAENVTMDAFKAMAKERKYPAGSSFVAILGTVFGPDASAKAARRHPTSNLDH